MQSSAAFSPRQKQLFAARHALAGREGIPQSRCAAAAASSPGAASAPCARLRLGGTSGLGFGSLPESCPTLPCGILFSKGDALVKADLGEGWGELGVTCLSLIALMHTEY